MRPTTATKNACIATALVLLGLGLIAAPTAVADDEPNQDIIRDEGPCYVVDPWVSPPAVGVNPDECIP